MSGKSDVTIGANVHVLIRKLRFLAMMTVDCQSNQAAESLVASQHSCLDITVVIPTYNGGERVPQVLDRLKQQVDVDALTWEVIVCDNNSCDRTADVVSEYQQNWLPQCPLRYCFVAEQGAAYARQRGVMEASGTIVAFLDDDNIPAHDWLSQVQQFAIAYPQAGAFGSQIHGDFQGVLPDGFEHIACFLAIVERGNSPHLYRPASKILPPAAGLAVRKDAWIASVPERLFLNHKGKSAGLASEDLEAMLHIQKAGWEIWYNSDMVVTHQIPGERLQREYLVTLLRCVGLSRFYIRWLGTKDWQRLFKVPAYIANDLRKLALHYLKNGPRQSNWDIVVACERSLLTSTLASPVFLLRKLSQDRLQNQQDQSQLPERQQWLRRLTDAFEDRQLELYQQKIVWLNATESFDKRLANAQFEVLLRLRQNSAEQRPVSPRAFFPTAKRYGLMRTLDRRVVQQVCRMLRSPTVGYFINLSDDSVVDLSFLTFLEEQLIRYQVKPEGLCFEISETAVIRHAAETKTLIEHLHHLGIKVSIDELNNLNGDFFRDGTQLSVDYIKLGKGLLERLITVQNSALLERIKLIQQEGVQLVAKGVETQTALERVQALGLEYAQGYHLSQPSPFNPVD